MAAVASSTQALAEDEAAVNITNSTNNDDDDHVMSDNEGEGDAVMSDNDEDDEEDDEPVIKEWDEGGKSHCGYGDQVHETLMSIGQSIHKVVGEPNENIKSAMDTVGNWFQEASYAARDFKRGNMNVAEEMKSVVTGDEQKDDEVGEEGEGEEGGEREEDEKLEPVKEEECSTNAAKEEEVEASA